MISAWSAPFRLQPEAGDERMIGFLRRRQPRNPALRGLYWIVVLLVVVGLLFVIFYFADDLLPGQGMF
jgi:hypothetical protein